MRALSFGIERAKIQILLLKTDKRNAKHICLSKDSHKKTFLVHRLVLRTFVGEPPVGKNSVNHKNGNPSDNQLENLEWCSSKYNTQHALRTGLIKNIGENNWQAKLTKKDVMEIRKSKLSQKELAKKYNVHQGHLNKIINNKIWINYEKRKKSK